MRINCCLVLVKIKRKQVHLDLLVRNVNIDHQNGHIFPARIRLVMKRKKQGQQKRRSGERQQT